MKEESQSIEMDPFDDSDFSSDLSSDFDSPEKPSFISRFICRGRGVTQVQSHILYRHTAFHNYVSSDLGRHTSPSA